MGASDSQRAKAPERRCPKKQRGIATVELAIAVPVLLLLMLASAEAGRWLYQYNTLHKAVRDAVRFVASGAIRGTTGIMYGPTTAEWGQLIADTQDRVHDGYTGDLEGFDIQVAQVGSTQVVVTATYNYNPIFDMGIPTFGLGNGPINFDIDMTASATMRAL